MKVPHVLHQVWLDGAPPRVYSDLARRMRGTHSHWEYRLWSKADVGMLVNEVIYQNMIAEGRFDLACDILRYEVVARHGGVYADIDCYALKPLDELFDGISIAFAVESVGWCTNALFGASPNHPFMWKLVRNLPGHFAAARVYPHAPIDWTGPRYITDSIENDATLISRIPVGFLMRYRGEDIGDSGFMPRSSDYLVHLWGHQGVEAISRRVAELDRVLASMQGTGPR